jgi:hypothetical protein
MNLNNNLSVGRDYYRAFPSNSFINYPTDSIDLSSQDDALREVNNSDAKETRNVITDFGKFIDPDPLTSEEILDLNESLNDVYLNKTILISGRLDAKTILAKILEFADDQ